MNKVLLLFLSPVLFANAADTCKLNLKADFQMNDACAGTAVSFHNLSTIRYPNATFLWDFGDNTTSADTAPGRIDQVGVGTQTFVVKLVILIG